MSNLTPEDEAILKLVKQARKERIIIPEEYRFPPLNDKFCEGVEVESQWMLEYFFFRASLEKKVFNEQKQEIDNYLKSINKYFGEPINHYRGSLLGLAVGDAMGASVEFRQRDSYPEITEYKKGGPHNLDAGDFTDDASMALCLAHSLLRCNDFDPKDQMDMYTLWWKRGIFSSTNTCFDIGNTTRKALELYEQTGNPYSGLTDERSAGNGSLMRLAPIVLYAYPNAENVIHYAGESSRTTHGAQECIDACRYFAALLYGSIRRVDKDTLLNGIYAPYEDCWRQFPLGKKVMEIAQGSYKTKHRDDISSSGYVIDTLEAALWAFYTSDDFKTGMIKAVNLGGDTDTIGAVYGQLAGAFYGEYRIPADWIRLLAYQNIFYLKADQFFHRN